MVFTQTKDHDLATEKGRPDTQTHKHAMLREGDCLLRDCTHMTWKNQRQCTPANCLGTEVRTPNRQQHFAEGR